MPLRQKSLLLLSSQGDFAVQDTDVPTPARGEILVRVEATALNPADWKIVAYNVGGVIRQYPAVLGSDAAGVVEAVGEGVRRVSVGDRVYVPWYRQQPVYISVNNLADRLFQGGYVNGFATFQQFTAVSVSVVAKVRNVPVPGREGHLHIGRYRQT